MGWEVHGGNRRLPQSLGLIARFGLRNGLAKGYAIDRLVSSGEAWERRFAEGLTVPTVDGNGLLVVTFPLGTEETDTGALSFVLDATCSKDARDVLGQIAKVCQAIWPIWHTHSVYAREILRIADLEAELADAKIADRAQAVLQMSPHPSNPSDPVDVISRSVNAILGPSQLGNVLKEVLGDLERDTYEYDVIRRAKDYLQERQKITEAQAYLHLRQVSRQTRRPLPDVANELMKLGFVTPRTPSRNARRA